MDDKFLHDLRREPAPEFANALKARLDERDRTRHGTGFRSQAVRWMAMAASAAVVAFVFSLPSVRATAGAFLDIFRIGGFSGISVDVENLQEREPDGLEFMQMFSDDIEILSEPGATVSYGSLDEAAAAVGIDAIEPAYVPVGWERTGIEVNGGLAVSMTARTDELNTLLQQLMLDDLSVPAGLDGQQVTVRVPAILAVTYSMGDQTIEFAQSASPEISFPAGVEVAQLAEIALRIFGLDRDEAYRLAWSIDWRSSFLIPVPRSIATFEEVDIGGSDGIMIQSRFSGNPTLLLWASDGRTYGLSARLPAEELIEMAQTAQ